MADYLDLTPAGLLPAGADVDAALRGVDERALTAVWHTYHHRRLYRQMLQDDTISDRARAAFTADLERTAEVSACQALDANARLVERLTADRWTVMRDAREAGASWADIGAALGMTRQAAHEWYQRKLEQHERYAPDLIDTTRARAVLEPEDVTCARCHRHPPARGQQYCHDCLSRCHDATELGHTCPVCQAPPIGGQQPGGPVGALDAAMRSEVIEAPKRPAGPSR